MEKTEKPQFGKTPKGLIFLRHVRVQPFCAIYRPEVNLSGAEVYTVTCEISEEQLGFLEAEMKKAAESKWKDKAPIVLKKLDNKNKGARMFVVNTTGDEYPGIKASRYAKARNGNAIKAPLVRQRGGKIPSVAGGPDEIYPGCYADLVVEPVAYDFNGVKGIKFDFAGIAFNSEGDRLGGRVYATDDDFEGLGGEPADAIEEGGW